MGIHGMDCVTVHGGARKARNIHGRDDLLSQNRTPGALQRYCLLLRPGSIVENYRFGFLQGDEASKLLRHAIKTSCSWI
jgi:hypothetical protein